MGVIDDHNRQHTHGNSAGPPTSVVGVSAQQAIDANKRLSETGGQGASSGAELKARDAFRIALGCGVVVLVAVQIAYVIGGMGAVAIGLVAVIAGFVGVIFLVIALIHGAKSGVAALGSRRR